MSKRNVTLTLTPAQARLLQTLLLQWAASEAVWPCKKTQSAALFRVSDALAEAIAVAHRAKEKR